MTSGERLKRDAVIEVANRQIGEKESPPGSNVCKFNDFYYEGRAKERYKRNPKPYAWCGTAVAFIFHFANIYLASDLFTCIGYVPTAQNWLEKNNKETKTPQAADIVIFDWQHDGFEDHIGIFFRWSKSNPDYCYVFEGNTSKKGSQSNGGEFLLQKRHKSLIEGFYDVISK